MRLLLALVLAAPILAHVGSPDVFFTGEAGPYKLLVTIRPPQVIPGVAEVDIRSLGPDVRQIHLVPLPMRGPGALLAPVPDLARPSKEDPQFYSGALWLMAHGSWKVRVDVDGAQGTGRVEVPVPALATRITTMDKTLGFALLPLGLVLAIGIISIAGASAREAPLETGAQPSAARVRLSRIVMVVATLLVAGAVWGANAWWDSDAGDYLRYVFKPLKLDARLEHGNQLALQLVDPGWLNRRTDDLLPDHGHLMHLYLIRMPQWDAVWHLHPERAEAGRFEQVLPSMPAGHYALYGDVVHASGLAETATAQAEWPEVQGAAPAGDDAGGAVSLAVNRIAQLPGGYQMVWLDNPSLHTKQPQVFRFRLQDAAGKPASDMELYMGMLGHAAFVAADGSVFAHIHPSGTVPMPALALTQSQNPHAEHMMMQGAVPSEVSFPYGFPKAGDYRIIVQMKHAGHVETGVFPVRVEN